MRVDFFPDENIRTNMPIEIRISQEARPPKVEVLELGLVPLRKVGDSYRGEFWSQKEGKYQVVVRGEHEIWKTTLNISQQKYVTFNQEMTLFLIVFLAASVGLILWMKKIKKI